MQKIQDIVPVNIQPDNIRRHDPVQSHPNNAKPKVALRLKRGDMDITFYNGCDKYILYTALKELNAHDC
jgi:hypothetical protein